MLVNVHSWSLKMRFRIQMVIVAMIAVPVLLSASGCSSAKGDTAGDKRQYAQLMRDDVLNELYGKRPEAQQKVANAAGYGVFTNIGSKVFVIAMGNGYGIVRDNATGQDTYMRMAEVGGGLGMGVEQYRAVFVFHDRDVMRKFVEEGWEVGADASAAAKAGDTGAAAGAQAASEQLSGVEIYELTSAGIALSATATAAKYYPDEKLNQ
jgi:lipid-binding SYLF domain-containing protein